MLKRFSYIRLILVFIVSYFMTTFSYAQENKNMSQNVYEILKWQSKVGVTDADMIAAVNDMVKDLKTLNGFLNQTLYKDKNGAWVDIYYWATEADAVASNDAMAGKASFVKLIDLIAPDSVSLEIMKPLQTSGDMVFK